MTDPVPAPDYPGAWTAFRRSLLRVLREPLGALGLAMVTVGVVSALGADWLAPYDPNRIDIRAKLESPSAEHLLGTDQLGRDIFSRVLVGGQIALEVSLVAIGAALALALVLGLIAGFGQIGRAHV